MDELDLFCATSLYDFDMSLLDYYARQGHVFLTTKQVMAVTKKTYGQIRYAIFNYELDAFYIFGDYRITIQAVRDYFNKDQETYEAVYHSVMNTVELDGVYELALGSGVQQAYRSVIQHHYPISAIDDLLLKNKVYDYEAMKDGQTDARDFYDIPSLNIPDRMLIGDLSLLLNVPVIRLMAMFNASDPYQELTYPEIYDFLVEKEVVNANIPFSGFSSQSFIKDDGQPELF